jgi:hypothetical protein
VSWLSFHELDVSAKVVGNVSHQPDTRPERTPFGCAKMQGHRFAIVCDLNAQCRR